MKPIHLEIEGLQSFRDYQSIDFATLGETGLFGIFGPTGSGKSTVLDAITYALYGRVKRADRGTQGIIHAERKSAAVAFTFLLNGPTGPRTYRVERTCQRKKGSEYASETRTARLVILSESGDVTLCDKSTEVTEAIFSLIGLNHEDFTKAVVLPQGSFAEFLQLDGTKKREMLERTFYLEAYGKELQDKLIRRITRVSREMERTTGELAGYTDATPAAVAQAGEALRVAALQRDGMEAEWTRMDSAFRDASALHDLVTEAETALKVRLMLETHAAEDALRRGHLAAARRAASLREPLRRFQEAQSAVSANEEEFRPIQVSLPILREEAKAVEAEQNRLQQEAAVDVPAWTNLKFRLAEAVAVRTEWEDVSSRLLKSCVLLERETFTLAGASTGVSLEEATVKRLESALEMLKFDLTAARVLPGRREVLAAATGMFHILNGQNDQFRVLEERQQAEAEAVSVAERKLAAVLTEQDACSLAAKTATGLLEENEKSPPWNRNSLLREHASIQAAFDLARRMADDLHPGMPCPVCGALEHPGLDQPAQKHPTLGHSALEHPAMGHTSLGHSVSDNQNMNDAADAERQQRLGVVEERIAAVDQWELQIRAMRDTMQSARERAVQAESGFWTAEAALQERRTAMMALSVTLGEKKLQQVQASQGLEEFLLRNGVSSLNTLTTEIVGQDKRHAELSKEVEGLEAELAAARIRLAALVQLRDAHGRESVRLQAACKGLSEQGDALDARLRERLSGLQADTASDSSALSRLKAEMEMKLHKHAERLNENTAAWHARQADLRGFETREAMLAERQVILTSALQTESSALDCEMARQGFDSAGAAEIAILSDAALAELETVIAAYAREWQQVSDECDRIAKRLDGRSMKEEEWLAMNASWRNAAEKRESATAAHEIARNSLMVLTERNLRWKALSERAGELSGQSAQLGQIQKVLKGDRGKDNSFIDYVAESRLRQIAASASETLHDMTGGKFTLVLDAESGFLVRDMANGGLFRPVSSLSGGETFLTSLSLALALSEQIQLKGQCPLEFFFLDEGFGTLDANLLDTVMDALSRLGRTDRIIGLISHVPEMKGRMARRLIVTPPGRDGEGSRVRLEKA